MTTQQVGSVLADRYELLDPLQGDGETDRYRALDRRLHREVVVEVERDGSAPASTAVGVRALAGADDTGMLAVLDGGEDAGRHFVVREVPRGSFDDTGVLHAGPTTAVLAMPPLHTLEPAPVVAAGRRGQGAWLIGLLAAVVAVVALAAWAGGDPPSTSVDPSPTVVADTTPTTSKERAVAATTPPTEPVTTTVPDVVSDPEETDRFPEGFPFDDGQPPGPGKKDGKKAEEG